MKATKLLKDQHREVEDLFKQALGTEDAEERRELLGQIKDHLESHMEIEEEIFYPALREAVQTKTIQEMVPESYEEHHVVKLVLEELPDFDPEDEQFKAKVTVLKELIEHHVEEEEKDLFKAAEKLGEQRLTELGEEMQEMMMGAEAGEEGEEDYDEEEEDEDDAELDEQDDDYEEEEDEDEEDDDDQDTDRPVH